MHEMFRRRAIMERLGQRRVLALARHGCGQTRGGLGREIEFHVFLAG